MIKYIVILDIVKNHVNILIINIFKVSFVMKKQNKKQAQI